MIGLLRYIYYRIKNGSHIHPKVVIGKNVYIGPNCIIGFRGEHKKYWHKKQNHSVVISDNTIITGLVTIDAGVEYDTYIGKGCFIMKHVHIGHDVKLFDNVKISPHASIGGFCEIGENSTFGMNSVIHQRAKVPAKCIIGMSAVITKSTKMWDNSVWVGNPAYYLRPNERV